MILHPKEKTYSVFVELNLSARDVKVELVTYSAKVTKTGTSNTMKWLLFFFSDLAIE